VEARGNIRLRLGTLAGASYQIQAEGNLNARIPEDVSLQLSLTSRAKNIKVRLPQGAQAIAAAEHELVLGDGAVEMRLVAGGNLYLVSEGGWEQGEPENFEMVGADFSNELSQQIAQQVETQIQAQIEAMTRQINAQVAQLTEQVGKAGLSPEETERLMEQARQTSERETARAEEKIRKAREKLELKLEAARRKQEVKAQAAQRRARVHRSWEFEPSTPKAKSEPVSEEERLMILSMLEQKKISLEEAEQLLASLEGREA
jgi:flagellar biosynthesis GTPase FlhF